ncbi:MAG: radical SAM protein [Myxococcales bacterium]|nr:radical SAM protein [Myxococcales bacterium]MCB9579896.1 radical SAM protein [Polyangiaceae bacterium]
MPPRSDLARLRLEREIYARVVATMDYPEASVLVHDIAGSRSRRFTPSELRDRWHSAMERAPENGAFNVYIHVPYCKSICDFCNYKRLHVASRAGLDEFVASIEAEVRLFAPAFRGVKFGALFVGGGTPSVLSPSQLDRLFDTLFSELSFHSGAQKNFEFDPMVMTPERHQVLSRHGFSRFSFGIQSVDVGINRLHNRGAQTRSHIDAQFEMLKSHGADHTNVDFLLGLAGTEPEKMLAEIEEVMAQHAPAEISVYFLFPTQEYVDAHFDGDYAKFRAFLEPFERLVPTVLRELAEKYDYRIGGDGKHIVVLTSSAPRHTRGADPKLFYCDSPANAHAPLYVLGFGDSARSRIFGELLYHAQYDSPGSEERYVGVETTLDDEVFTYLSFLLRDGDVLDRSLFRRTFGVDPVDALARPLRKLSSLKVVTVTDSAVRFVAQSREERIRDLLFFLPKNRREALDGLLSRGPAHVAAG